MFLIWSDPFIFLPYLILSCLIFSYLIVSSIYLTICRFLLHQIRPWRLMARKRKSMASQRWGKRRWIDGAGGRFYPVQRVQMCCSPINGPIRFLCPSKIDFSVAKMMEGGSTWVQNVDARANKEVSNGRTCNWNPASKDGSHSLINRKFVVLDPLQMECLLFVSLGTRCHPYPLAVGVPPYMYIFHWDPQGHMLLLLWGLFPVCFFRSIAKYCQQNARW